jgi:hypothetical protein
MTEFGTMRRTAIVHIENGRDGASGSGEGFCRLREPDTRPGRDSSSAARIAPPGEKWRASLTVASRHDLHAVRSLLLSAWTRASQNWQSAPAVYPRCGYEDTD